MTQEFELEIFRAGDYGPKGLWSEEDLDRIANSYDPNLHEAPVTLDHAQSGPSLGWVAEVRRTGDRLVARLRGLNDRLVEMLRAGEFKKRSVELYGAMPESGGPYLKAVSFLGAATPAVKGLRDLIFADSGETPAVPEAIADAEKLDFEFPTADSPAPDDSASQSFAEITREQFNELKQSLQRSGIWRPTWDDQGIAAFFAAIAQIDETETEFGDLNPTEWLGRFLGAMPSHVPMGETATMPPNAIASRLPHADNVAPESVARHRKAVALCESQPELSYSQALART